MIALISSIPEEGKKIVREIKNPRISASPQLHIIQGKIHGRDVVYAVSGIGKTNAAHAATVLIEKFSPDIIILFGVGGAYPSSGLKIGDIAVAEKEVYGDEGVLTEEGFQGTELIGIPLLRKGRKKYFNEFQLDKKIVEKAIKSFRLVTRHSSFVADVKAGTFVTVSTCTGPKKRAMELQKRFNAICENMEGAAVAHICTAYGIPMLELRGISNIVGHRNRDKWNIKLSAGNCQQAVIDLLKAV